MLENPEELIGGMKIILQLFDHAKGVLGIEDNKPDCIEKLTELVKDEPRIEVCPLQTKYPQGGERQLIYAVTGRAINSKMLPADAGCIVDNVETIIAGLPCGKAWQTGNQSYFYDYRRCHCQPGQLLIQHRYQLCRTGGGCRRI